MSPVRIALAVVLLAAAVVAALLALSVRAAADALATGDAGFLAGERADWTSGSPLAGAAERALALSDDLDARGALALHRRATREGPGFGGGLERQGIRSAAEAALARVAQDQAGPRAAQAGVLLGTLLFADPGAGSAQGPTPADRALAAFGNALDAEPGDDAAAYDLELLLRLLEARGERPGSNAGAGPRGGGRRGAGGGTPGRGY
ncbi:MAG: hypothetical protein ACM33B_02270 [Pseudomonadota bacterium]